MKNVKYLIMLMVLMVAATGCGKFKGGKAGDTVPVKAMSVRVGDLNKTLEYVGNIKGKDEALIYPKVSGKVIEKVKNEGTTVKKGEAIMYVDRDEIGLKFEKAPVESPIDGFVGRVYVDIGTNVTQTTPVALVADMEKAKVELDVPEKYINKIALDKPAEVRVDAYPGEKFYGKIYEMSPVVEEKTRSVLVKVLIDNEDHRLRSGMFAKVTLILEVNKGIPIILKEAVMGKEPDTYVYVVENDKAVLRKVKLGDRQGPLYEVKEGVKGGELVVIMGQQKLRDGLPVSVEIEQEVLK